MAYITINRQNFFHNLNQIALKTGSIDKISVVLKDNAYGHGLTTMAKLAFEFGIQSAVVKNKEEAEQIKPFFKDILILNDKAIKDDNFSFTLNSLESIKNAKESSKVELKVDTGMHRNGIAMGELKEAMELIKKHKLELVGVMTHFASADELGSELFWQQKNFESVKKIVKELGYINVRFHSFNSAATLRLQNYNEEMVRVGISIYGYSELGSAFDSVELKPVLALYAKKVSSRLLEKSQRVGYSGAFIAPKSMLVSTYDLGYGDGWFRADSKNSYLTTEGLHILGRVSMDFISLESTKDEVVVMDDAQKTAKHFQTICYEILTALSSKLERVIV